MEADQLLYKYERPLILKYNGRDILIYPDFTIINTQTGKLTYWEHAGLMSNPEYVSDFVWKNKLKKMPGNAEKYSLENIEPLENSPLGGKRICYLGSSVTLGLYSMDVSFADYISYRNGCEYVKEAVSGTTLVDNGKTSYIQRMKNNIGTDEKFDAFVCQLSTNDASKEMPIGELSRSENLEDFDTQTITGAMEYITVYAKQTWNCPVIFYTGTKYDSKQYQQMVDVLFELQDKYGIGVIDLWNDEEMNDVSEKEYEVYMADPVHPTQAGYLEWWTPKMEEYLYQFLER